MPTIQWLPPERVFPADLGVLIVSWNVKELLLRNLETLFASEGTISAEVIVIDNGSKDGTVEAVRNTFPQVRVIANTENVGFARANMQGMVAMRSRHALLLNPDMKVATDALQKTVEYLDAHPDVAVVGAKLMNEDGSHFPSVRRFPDLASQLAIVLKLPRLFPGLIKKYLAKDFDAERVQSVDSVRGSYFAIHRLALEALGGLDTRYFIWFEEVDYCKLAVTRGWKVMYVPSLHATDLVGRSFGQRKRFWTQKMFTKSMVAYFRKWHPAWQGTLLACLRPFVLLSAWIFDCLA